VPETLDGVTDLDDRYGRHRRTRPRWFWPVVASIGIAVGVAWAAWAAFSDVPVHQAEVFGYEVVDDRTTTVQLDVYRDEPVALRCTVYAQAQDKSVVGEKSVDLPESGDEHVRVSIEIRTERRAVTGRLEACETH